jgi:hypothetical protein
VAMRLLITLLGCLILAPAALAAGRATGDGVLELKSVDGGVSIGAPGQPAKGVLWGQMDRGRLTIVDPITGDGQIVVSGWDTRSIKDPTTADGTPRVVVYTGVDLHFRVTGGKYRLKFTGSGVDLTAVGVGVAYLSGDPDASDAGFYAVDSGKWLPVPVLTQKVPTPKAVPFGDQPPQTP